MDHYPQRGANFGGGRGVDSGISIDIVYFTDNMPATMKIVAGEKMMEQAA